MCGQNAAIVGIAKGPGNPITGVIGHFRNDRFF
jgi:hypothetical protein